MKNTWSDFIRKYQQPFPSTIESDKQDILTKAYFKLIN